jgi:RHS repeat-associated protein
VNFTPAVEVGFTGHPHDDDLGLIDMRGRVYDPAIRRFLTPDPLVSFPLFGQAYNLYSYVLNNPLNLVDPTGFSADDAREQGVRDGPAPIRGNVPVSLNAGKRLGSKAAAPPTSVPKGAPKDTSDSSGRAPSTGATAAPSESEPAALAPAAEIPSAPASPAPVAPSAGAGVLVGL